MGNFITNCVEKQMDPWGELYADTWNFISKIWNSIFIAELAWNIYGSWYISTCAVQRLDMARGDACGTSLRPALITAAWSFSPAPSPGRCGHGKHFLCSGWNIFDFIVVAVSVPQLLDMELPPPSDKLRLLRAFRVFRLFKRIKSLNSARG